MGVRAIVAAGGVLGDRGEFERLWANRVEDARLRLAFARNYLKEVQRDFPVLTDGKIPDEDGWRKARNDGL